jgi:D-alanyl-lipoteichoic acid acyltransferase DltB (MBOAT superfamily)
MSFNSLDFLIFFPMVILTFFLLPHRWRWLQLLIASCIFYMMFIPVYILILLFTILVDYIAGILIGNATGSARKVLLALSIIVNVGVLALFKYYNFFIGNLNHLGYSFPLLKIILPLGLSFHTFQVMSYTIEVYRGRQKAERHLGIYALYVMFFPQLVAGPIERPQNTLHQFHSEKKFDADNLMTGLKLILWGLFRKVVIADRLAVAADFAFSHPHDQTSLALLIAMVFYAIQIYCDFSGYSLMAIGSAKAMGFDLVNNFRQPFLARNITEFWRRWHISLTTWLTDYLYTPVLFAWRGLGKWATVLAALFTFFISGLWHGAGWTFIVWGLLHGLAISYEFLTRKFRNRLSRSVPAIFYNPVTRLFTLVYVCFAWIFFRASNLSDAWFIVRKIGAMDSLSVAKRDVFGSPNAYLGLTPWDFAFTSGLIFVLLAADLFQKNIRAADRKNKSSFRYATYFLLVFSIIFLGVYKHNRFIYFQF